jgi:hypothetical protein
MLVKESVNVRNRIELRLERHDAPCAVYLEPETLATLNIFWSICKEAQL